MTRAVLTTAKVAFAAVLVVAAVAPKPASANNDGVAVVELFTSEGCSSCPPAEALLNRIDVDARARNRPVYVLAFHVDYWNYLGWDDRFSAAEFTARQRAYANQLAGGRAYTPQMVINGQEAFVGSKSDVADAAIKKALARPRLIQMSVTATRDGQTVRARASVDAPPGVVVQFALVEDGLVSNVTSGENHGRRLIHRGVVRAFSTARVREVRRGDSVGRRAKEAVASLQVPKGVRGALSVVAFAQDSKTLTVLSASRAELLDPPSDTRAK